MSARSGGDGVEAVVVRMRVSCLVGIGSLRRLAALRSRRLALVRRLVRACLDVMDMVAVVVRLRKALGLVALVVCQDHKGLADCIEDLAAVDRHSSSVVWAFGVVFVEDSNLVVLVGMELGYMVVVVQVRHMVA